MDAKPKISPARSTAFDILLRVERDGAYAGELLNSAACERLTGPDRALAMEIVMGVLRWRARLDAAIMNWSRTPLRKLDVEVLTALRMGVFQLGWLDRIPARAAIHQSVELVKRARKASAAPTVNAILRKLSSGEAPIAAAPDDAPAAVRFSHPEWLVERWTAEYGAETAAGIAAFGQQVPPVALRLRGDAAPIERELLEVGVELAPGALLREARVVVRTDIVAAAAFREGRVAIQDEASQLVALLTGRGERILDCCAAPGGKTALLADRNPNARILAVELHEHRARTLRKRVPNENVEVRTGDITALAAGDSYDRVLADVPCSGTGTLAHNPEIKWRLAPADLEDLHRRQVTILHAALDRLAPGGRAVYSTCSLEREECEAVVEEVLAARPEVRLADAAGALATLASEGLLNADPASLVRGPYLRTLPGTHPCDGFFAAILERSE